MRVVRACVESLYHFLVFINNRKSKKDKKSMDSSNSKIGDDDKFVSLTDAQRSEIAPLAQQFNKWLLSLIDTIAAETLDAADQRTLQALKGALGAVTTLKPTVPFEHFAYQVRYCLEVVCESPEEFITQLAPSIAYVQKLGVTPAKWASYSELTRSKVCQHVETLGEMCCELVDYREQLAQSTQSTQPPSLLGGIPPEILAQIKASLPPAVLEQVSRTPGGLEQFLAQVISQNPALSALLGGGGSGDDGDSVGLSNQAAAALPLAGIGSLFESLKSQLSELPDDATPAQKDNFYVQIASWLGEQIQTEGSVVYSMFTKFEQAFPNGLTRVEVDGWIDRGRSLLKVMGLAKGDAAWVLVRRLTGFIDKMQDETKSSRFSRETAASKVTSLVRLASESEGGLEGLFETAMQSQKLKELVSTLTGMPIAEVTKDPFAAVKKATSASASASSDMSSILGGMFGGGAGGASSDDDDKDNGGDVCL